VALGTIGWTYQTIAAERDRRAQPAPGQMTFVSGHSLHMQHNGQGEAYEAMRDRIRRRWKPAG
jgi:hypothetical protein